MRVQVYSEARIAGVRRWYLGDPAEHDMRLGNDLTICVGFLCIKQSGKYRPFGNAFIIEHPSLTTVHYSPGFEYLVTAKHLVADGQKHGGLFLRLNTKDGGVDHVRISGDWHYPNDEVDFETDLAIIRFKPPHGQFIYRPLPSYSLILNREDGIPVELMHGDVGLGDNLCTVGLFSGHYGEKRNIPLLSFGTIAAMPDQSEPLRDKYTRKKYVAYLVEMRSIAGLSGSPVFLLTDPEGKATRRQGGPIVFVLGLIRSYWYYNIDSGALSHSNEILPEVNVGLSAVTPSQKIYALLDSDEVTKEREEEAEASERFKSKLASGRTSTPQKRERKPVSKSSKRSRLK